nr:hypothetical protein [Tanacetum cinerariifolium]
MALEKRKVKLDEGHAGSDPGNTLESRPLSDEDQTGSNPRPSHVALVGPNPEPMHEHFIATNLDDDFTFGDHFIVDESTEEEPGKANVEFEVKSMVTVPPVRKHFRELLEFDMKETLRDRMFESGSYRSHLEHAALYEALEASMDRKNKDEFLEATAKSHKRRRNDQDPPPPPPSDSDQSKKKRHDSDASAPYQPQAQTSSA